MNLSEVKVDSKIWFEGEKQGYTVQARNERYIVCTKPFNLKKTTLYTIVDLEDNVRGTENLVFGEGFEARQDCEEAILRLSGQDTDLGWETEVSYRNRVRLQVTKIL